jgi:hypothetical protein
MVIYHWVCSVCGTVEPVEEDRFYGGERRVRGGGTLCLDCEQDLYDREEATPSEAKTNIEP